MPFVQVKGRTLFVPKSAISDKPGKKSNPKELQEKVNAEVTTKKAGEQSHAAFVNVGRGKIKFIPKGTVEKQVAAKKMIPYAAKKLKTQDDLQKHVDAELGQIQVPKE